MVPQIEATPVRLEERPQRYAIEAGPYAPTESDAHGNTSADRSQPTIQAEGRISTVAASTNQIVPPPTLNPQREDPNEAVRANVRLAKQNAAHNSQWANLQPDAEERPKGRGQDRSEHFEGEEEAIRRSLLDQQVTAEVQEATRDSLREQENSQREQEAINRSLRDQEVIREEADEQEVLLRALKRQESLLVHFEEKQAADARELQGQRDVVAQLREQLRGLET